MISTSNGHGDRENPSNNGKVFIFTSRSRFEFKDQRGEYIGLLVNRDRLHSKNVRVKNSG